MGYGTQNETSFYHRVCSFKHPSQVFRSRVDGFHDHDSTFSIAFAYSTAFPFVICVLINKGISGTICEAWLLGCRRLLAHKADTSLLFRPFHSSARDAEQINQHTGDTDAGGG